MRINDQNASIAERAVADISRYHQSFTRRKALSWLLVVVLFLELIAASQAVRHQPSKTNLGQGWKIIMIPALIRGDRQSGLEVSFLILALQLWMVLSKVLFVGLGWESALNNRLALIAYKMYPFVLQLVILEHNSFVCLDQSITNLAERVLGFFNTGLQLLICGVTCYYNMIHYLNGSDELSCEASAQDMLETVLLTLACYLGRISSVYFQVLFFFYALSLCVKELSRRRSQILTTFGFAVLGQNVYQLAAGGAVWDEYLCGLLMMWLLRSLVEAYFKWLRRVQLFEESKQNTYAMYQCLKEGVGPQGNNFRFLCQYLERHMSKCADPHCICRSSKDKEEVFKLCLMQEAKDTIKEELIICEMQLQLQRRPISGLSKLMCIDKNGLKLIDEAHKRLILKRGQVLFESMVIDEKLVNQNMRLAEALQYFDLCDQLEQLIKTTIFYLVQLYEVLGEEVVDIHFLENYNEKVNGTKKEVDAVVRKVIEEYTEGEQIYSQLRFYYSFVEIYKSRLPELEEVRTRAASARSIKLEDDISLDDNSLGLVMIDLLERLGSILNYNSIFEQIFGYSHKELIGFNIRVIMPSVVSAYHNNYLNEFIETGRVKLLRERKRTLFGKSKNSRLVEVSLRIKLYLGAGELRVAGLLNNITESVQYYMVDSRGRILQVSENAMSFLKSYLDMSMYRPSDIQLYRLIPVLMGLKFDSEDSSVASTVIVPEHQSYSRYFRFHSKLFDKGLTEEHPIELLENLSESRDDTHHSLSMSNSVGPAEDKINFLYSLRHFIKFVDLLHCNGFKAFFSHKIMQTKDYFVRIIEVKALERLPHRAFFEAIVDQLDKLHDLIDPDQNEMYRARIEQYQQYLSTIPEAGWNEFVLQERKKSNTKDLPSDLRFKFAASSSQNTDFKQFELEEKENKLKFPEKLFMGQSSVGSSRFIRKSLIAEALEQRENYELKRMLYLFGAGFGLLFLGLGVWTALVYLDNSWRVLADLDFLMDYCQITQNLVSFSIYQTKGQAQNEELLKNRSVVIMSSLLFSIDSYFSTSFPNVTWEGVSLPFVLELQSLLSRLVLREGLSYNLSEFMSNDRKVIKSIEESFKGVLSTYRNQIIVLTVVILCLSIFVAVVIVPVYVKSEKTKKALLQLIAYFRKETVQSKKKFYQQLVVLIEREGAIYNVSHDLILYELKDRSTEPVNNNNFGKKQRTVLENTSLDCRFLSIIACFVIGMLIFPAVTLLKFDDSVASSQFLARGLIDYHYAAEIPGLFTESVLQGIPFQGQPGAISTFLEKTLTQQVALSTWTQISQVGMGGEYNNSYFDEINQFLALPYDNTNIQLSEFDSVRLQNWDLLRKDIDQLSSQSNLLMLAVMVVVLGVGTAMWLLIAHVTYVQIRNSVGEAEVLYSNLAEELLFQNSYVVTYFSNKITEDR